ncbi:MAG: carbohydrate ABC transporter permease [Chloroflexota bacterium]
MATQVIANRLPPRRSDLSLVQRDAWKLIGIGTVFTVLTLLAIVYLAPLVYMITTSFKSEAQLNEPEKPLLPTTYATFSYQGQALPLYDVTQDGTTRRLALLQELNRSKKVILIDPQDPSSAQITLNDRLPVLREAGVMKPVSYFDPKAEVYVTAADSTHMDFGRSFINTLAISGIGAIGAMVSASLVAYGFSRFRIPGANFLFLLLMATIILPPQVTLIPTYIVFQKIGWTGSLLPLIVPTFFSNAYNVFLLRQYFMGIPNEMDEAAKVDGASPIQTFLWVVVPQARAALITVFLFHFLVTWGEYYNALIFTSGSKEAQPLSVALGRFLQIYSAQPNMLMAGAVLTMLMPLLIFFLAQRAFMQGIVITGVDK